MNSLISTILPLTALAFLLSSPVEASARTVSYQCKTLNGIQFQQRPCERGKQTVLIHYDTSNFESGVDAQQHVVSAINEMTKANPTRSGPSTITVIGRSTNAADGKADGFREVDRSVKGSNY